MFLALNGYDWCAPGSGIIKALSFIRSILNIVRWVVPIGLIGFTTYEMIKKVINPDDKDFMKHISNRVIAAVVIFFVPMIISILLKVIDIARGTTDTSGSTLRDCWSRAGGGTF